MNPLGDRDATLTQLWAEKDTQAAVRGTARTGTYDTTALSNVYTGNDARARLVLQAVRDKIVQPAGMKALGFYVDTAHAAYMARVFTDAGLPSTTVLGTTPARDRDQAVADLKAGRIVAIFTVDVFNEGVDIPAINTVHFLRPTESATVFLQQLGRGLRLADDKPVLTALDFVGHHRADFRFDRRYRALTGSIHLRALRICGIRDSPPAPVLGGHALTRNVGSPTARPSTVTTYVPGTDKKILKEASMSETTQTKTQRLNLRCSAKAVTTLRDAAAVQNQDLTSFVLGAALERARGVLTEDLLLRLTPDEVKQVEKALAEDVTADPNLAGLFRARTPKGSTG